MSPWTAIAPDVWGYEYTLRNGPGVAFPVRTTAIRLPGGDVVLHSPGDLTTAAQEALDAIGPVRHLLAANTFHHLFLARAMRRWPEATVWAARPLRDKHPELSLTHAPCDAPPFADVLVPFPMQGAPSMDETVFVHRPTRSLLVTDLVFNIRRGSTEGCLTPGIFWLSGTWNRLACSRVWTFAVKDRLAFQQAVEAMLAEPFDRLVPCHGHIVETGAHTEVARALAGWRSPPAATS